MALFVASTGLTATSPILAAIARIVLTAGSWKVDSLRKLQTRFMIFLLLL
jgi:hypothetical protein